MTRQPSLPHWLSVTGCCLLALLAGFLVYGSTGHDDSHINFWVVHTLLTRGELVNYNGERVEQTTSLLQDCLTAALAFAWQSQLVTLGYLVDIFAALASCLLGLYLAWQLAPGLALWLPALVLASGSFLLWTYGGMGAPLTALCLLATIAGWHHWLTVPRIGLSAWIALALLTLALVLVRPEMPLVATAMAMALTILCWAKPAWRRRSLVLLGMMIVASLGLLLWQHIYFGSWLPVPAVAKQGGDWLTRWQRGSYYWLFSSVQNPVVPLALLASLPVLRDSWQAWIGRIAMDTGLLLRALAALTLWTYGGFVWTAGGDWMQAGRFFVPLVAPAALLLLAMLERWPLRWLAVLVAATLTLLQTSLQYPLVATKSHGTPAWVQTRILPEHAARYGIFERLNQEHVRDMAVIDHLAEIIPSLHRELGRPVRLMSGQAGMVFYYTAQQFAGQVHFRDLRGLVEGSLTLCPVLRDVPRSAQGLFWGYREFFAYLPQLEQQCGITAPDIIYDLNDMTQKMGKTLEPLGYTLIHRETGFVVENPTTLPYFRLLSPNMIFVRNELLPLLGDKPLRIVDYSQRPLAGRWPFSQAP